MDLFNTILVQPIINILVVIYHGLLTLHIPYTLAFAIILLTSLVRLILYPITASQMRASKKMQELAPHLSRIREKHKGDTKRQQQETMLLYQQHKVNPAAGCLPVLIQLPLFWALYSVLRQVVTNNAVSFINSHVYFPALKIQGPLDTAFSGCLSDTLRPSLWQRSVL